jgi:excisionase family DNA binding protein
LEGAENGVMVTQSTEKKELLAAEDVAELMGVKETTVWRWCREGRLPCLKVGKHWRLRREALEDFLKQQERSAEVLTGRERDR